MKKVTKRFLALTLILAMLCAFSMQTFAATPEDGSASPLASYNGYSTGTVLINGAQISISVSIGYNSSTKATYTSGYCPANPVKIVHDKVYVTYLLKSGVLEAAENSGERVTYTNASSHTTYSYYATPDSGSDATQTWKVISGGAKFTGLVTDNDGSQHLATRGNNG